MAKQAAARVKAAEAGVGGEMHCFLTEPDIHKVKQGRCARNLCQMSDAEVEMSFISGQVLSDSYKVQLSI